MQQAFSDELCTAMFINWIRQLILHFSAAIHSPKLIKADDVTCGNPSK